MPQGLGISFEIPCNPPEIWSGIKSRYDLMFLTPAGSNCRMGIADSIQTLFWKIHKATNGLVLLWNYASFPNPSRPRWDLNFLLTLSILCLCLTYSFRVIAYLDGRASVLLMAHLLGEVIHDSDPNQPSQFHYLLLMKRGRVT